MNSEKRKFLLKSLISKEFSENVSIAWYKLWKNV